MLPSNVLAFIVLVAGVILLFKSVIMVPQGYEWTVEKFGRYTHHETGPPFLDSSYLQRRTQSQHDGTGTGCTESRSHHQR